MSCPDRATEHVLLPTLQGGVVFDVPEGATRCRVPNTPEAPADVRGKVFLRTGDRHPEFRLPMFRPKAYQC